MLDYPDSGHLTKLSFVKLTLRGYDSNPIRNQLKDTKLGILICDKNTLHEKLLLQKKISN